MTFGLKKQVFDGNAHLDKINGSDWMVAHRDVADGSGFFNHVLNDDYLVQEQIPVSADGSRRITLLLF
jgi:hypothetical protein